MNPDNASYNGLINAGAGTALAIVQLGAIIPGLLPVLALTLILAALVVLPLLALGLVVGVLAGPPAAAWWLWTRHRNRRCSRQSAATSERACASRLVPGPAAHTRSASESS